MANLFITSGLRAKQRMDIPSEHNQFPAGKPNHPRREDPSMYDILAWRSDEEETKSPPKPASTDSQRASSPRPKLPCRWETETRRSFTYYTYPQVGDEAAYASAPEDTASVYHGSLTTTSDAHWNQTGISANPECTGAPSSQPGQQESEQSEAPPATDGGEREQGDEDESQVVGDTAGTDSRQRMTVRERRAARKRKGTRKHLSEEELLRRQKRKQLERERADSRLLPDSGFSRRYHKPPFHSYGWGHRSPLKGGIMWGRYMASYSINPLLHPANTKTEEAMDQVDFVHNEALLHHEQNTLHRSPDVTREEGKEDEETLLDAARMTLDEERAEWRKMHETERAKSRHHHVSIKALQKPPPRKAFGKQRRQGGAQTSAPKPSQAQGKMKSKKSKKKRRNATTRKLPQESTVENVGSTDDVVGKETQHRKEEEEKEGGAKDQTNPPVAPFRPESMTRTRFHRGNSDQVRASLTWIQPETETSGAHWIAAETKPEAPPARATTAAAPKPKQAAVPPPIPPPKTQASSVDLNRFMSTQRPQTHGKNGPEVVVVPFVPGDGLERDPHLFKRLPPHWCQAIPPAGTPSAPSGHVKDALHMFD